MPSLTETSCLVPSAPPSRSRSRDFPSARFLAFSAGALAFLYPLHLVGQGDLPLELRAIAVVTVLDFRGDAQTDSLRLATCGLAPLLGADFERLLPEHYRRLLRPLTRDCQGITHIAEPLPLVTVWEVRQETDSSAHARRNGRHTILVVRTRTVRGRYTIVEQYRLTPPMLNRRRSWIVRRYQVLAESQVP